MTNRITEFEGLRGILAWWVVASHLLYNSGFGSMSDLNIVLKILRKGRSPVDVFIILSGFVIFYFLTSRKEKYNIFLLRRFFRLYPVYILCFALSVFLGLISLENMQSLPWASELQNYIQRNQVERSYMWQHVAAHITMLHGVFPDELLPDSTNAFLSPAWSISLEWQFYLVAPFVCGLMRRSKLFFLAISGIVILFTKYSYIAGYYPNPGFLPLKADLFWLGGVSCYVFQFSQNCKFGFRSMKFPLGVLFIVIVTIVFMNTYSILIPLAVWLVVLGAILIKDNPLYGKKSLLITDMLNNKYLNRLGKISYSTYLVHLPVIIICQYVILKLWPDPSKAGMLLMLISLTIPFTILISSILYRKIEKPFIDLGLRLAGKL